MSYSVIELRNKLDEKILGLGINPKFKENPAFDAALSEINGLITQMNMFSAAENVIVSEKEGEISFEWTSTTGEKNFVKITKSGPDTFVGIRTVEKSGAYSNEFSRQIRTKDVVEINVSLAPSGFMTIIKNGSMVDNCNLKQGACNNSPWAEKMYYSNEGIMLDREYKGYATGELTEDFDRSKVDSILYLPRDAFNLSAFSSDKHIVRTKLVREKFDTARIVAEDKSKGIRYNAVMRLNSEHGLRDMISLGGYNSNPQDVIIPPISQYDIEQMIQREKDPRVAQGLRRLAVGRETYYYNSAEDKGFICEGIEKPVTK